MSVTHINNIQDRILHSIKMLSPEQKQQVLDFIQSLQRNSLFQKWDNITDEEAQTLKNEFSEEDINLSESVMSDYLSSLEQEDKL